jgi:archaellum biogenesis protein FlaJ (TadC family)
MALLALNDDTLMKYGSWIALMVTALLIVTVIVKLITGSPIITHRYDRASRKRRSYALLAIWLAFMILMAAVIIPAEGFTRKTFAALAVLAVAALVYIARALGFIDTFRKEEN